MSALAYREPQLFSAGLLTLVVHAMFFAVLYFGMNWSVRQPQGMEVDLWASLPETAALPAPPEALPPPPPPKEEPVVRQKEAEKPAPPARVDIELAQKKKKAAKEEPKKLSKAEQKRARAEMEALNKQQEMAEQKEQAARAQQQAAQAAQAAAAAAAITSEVQKYIGLIRSKIRRNIVLPPDVPDDAEAEFVITLLPDGSLLDVKLRKSSGNPAYDEVVERAIRKAEPLPLPQDDAARRQFINPSHPRLKFSPKDGQ